MLDSHSLAEYSSYILNTPNHAELEQRLGLYRLFLKLYEHHRSLLDEILELENTAGQSRGRAPLHYVQAIVQSGQAYLVTNLADNSTRMLIQPQGLWVIGRDRKASLPVQDKRLSRRHAVIQYLETSGFFLIDLKSTNGTFLNGEPVRYCAPLKDGDQVRLGSLSFSFFVCNTIQVIATAPPELLEQVEALRQNTALSTAQINTSITVEQAPGTIEVDGEDSLINSESETFMFLRSTISEDDSLSDPLSGELNPARRAEILDRFLARRLHRNQN
jgi:pSer/pThr/pTyr-binding forkhead associated (FHA) protein